MTAEIIFSCVQIFGLAFMLCNNHNNSIEMISYNIYMNEWAYKGTIKVFELIIYVFPNIKIINNVTCCHFNSNFLTEKCLKI